MVARNAVEAGYWASAIAKSATAASRLIKVVAACPFDAGHNDEFVGLLHHLLVEHPLVGESSG